MIFICPSGGIVIIDESVGEILTLYRAMESKLDCDRNKEKSKLNPNIFISC